MLNEIYLRRRNKVVVINKFNSKDYCGLNAVLTLNKNIECLGFSFSGELVNKLVDYTLDELKESYLTLIPILKKMKGAHVKYRPMYPNFPQQVLDVSDLELYFNALVHYWSDGKLFPQYDKEERFPLLQDSKLTIINNGTMDDFIEIFKNLMSSKTSLSQTDKDDLKYYFEYEYRGIPEVIPHKENLAFIFSEIIKNGNITVDMTKYFKTATDVLRLAVGLSDGDVSLATNTKFRSFKRSERRILLNLLENCNNIEEDMLRYKNKWIKLGEKLHPGEYKQFNNVNSAFNKIRNSIKIYNFNSKLDYYKGNLDNIIGLLKERPGEFARRLDYLLRTYYTNDQHYFIVSEFSTVADKVSAPVLLQVMFHFRNRLLKNKHTTRSFFPKGNLSKIYTIENNLKDALSYWLCLYVDNVCENALEKIFSGRDKMGKVYLDKRLEDYFVPFSQRSASKSLKTIVRGSKISFSKDTDTIRAFVYWKNGAHKNDYYYGNDDRTDIDLSALMLDEDFKNCGSVYYGNLKDDFAVHSGDIVTAPNGASEFIDINIKNVQSRYTRYIAITLNSYTHQPYKDLPECFMGWMNREGNMSGEIYEPKTVENKVDITSDTDMCIPMVIDLKEHKIIWTDISVKSNMSWVNNIRGNDVSVSKICRAFVEMVKPNIYELIKLHVKTRGEFVDTPEEADITFGIDGCDVNVYDTDIFMGQYL